MKKKSTSEQLSEIEFHYKRFLIYYDYMMNHFFEPKYHDSSIYFLKEMKKMVDEDYQKKHLNYLRDTTKEVNTWLREELGSRAIEVKRLFRDQLGEDIDTEEQRYLKKLVSIRKRGKVRTEAEYRLVESRHQELFPEQGNTEEVLELDRLLGTYKVD